MSIQSRKEDFVIVNDTAKTQKLAGSLGKKIKDKNKLGLSDENLEKALEQSKIDYYKNWKV